ncbi:tetratricopeptide repeat protein [Rhizobium sp. TH2]|uniref:tetratricopeptide repeat protein n=1 Tax=Rhizobium sp. TH2 TaxID=2775403 RepID=UPI0021581CD5|nr:tetratricopeptide repeat protein [Rhizobium sp. TH2]UVC10169.1 tetratricopeptide repeat protein [Rhizobium sp. TH2]
MAKNRVMPPLRQGVVVPSPVRSLLDQAGRLLSAGKGAEALPIVEKAVALARANPEAAHMLGVCHLQAGNLAAGIEALKKAVMLAPANVAILNHLGVALCRSGKVAEGIAALERAVKLAPKFGEARNNLAHAFNESGDHAAAARAYREVTMLAPQLAPAWQGLASALHKSGDVQAALAVSREAAERFPGHSGFHASIGRILMDLRQRDVAEAAFRKALALDPGNGDAANNLGTLVEERGQHKEALALYQQATKMRPNLADAWFNLGNAREKTGDLTGARDAISRCHTLRSASARTLSALISIRRKLCDWDGIDWQVETLRQLVMAPAFVDNMDDGPPPFGLLSLMVDGATQLRAAEAHGRQTLKKAESWAIDAGDHVPVSKPAGGRIRIGYLSPDFREHPIAQLMAGVIESHDRTRFEISSWSLGPDDASAYRRRIVTGSNRFEDIRDLDVAASARLMREAELDIVVDLAGYTAHARPEVLALRVAPVQVNYLGYPGSMGSPFMDFVIVDPIVAPVGSEADFSEKIIRLPDCYQANDDQAPIDPGPVSRAEFGLPDDAFVFCSFSMNYKIDAAVLDGWVAILNRVPRSVLWLFRTDAAAAENIAREAEKRGLDPSRLIFADRLPKAKHLARHRLADLFLDTFAYGAHTTASDALWAGLPVLTLRGDTFARRVGASIVTAAGLPDLVTESIADYVERAVAIGSTEGASVTLKQRLQENIPSCALFSTAAIARNLEAAYLGMIESPG